MKILVYVDAGVLKNSFEQIAQGLRTASYDIQPCTARDLIQDEWERETDMLIIPGGRDIPYHEKLSPQGARRIFNYVAKGGSYLGICAGAYFGSSEIEFEKGGALEVCAKRDLAFFPGRAVGPALGLGKFRYDSESGAEAARIEWSDGRPSCYVYYNGGCYFEDSHRFPHVRVLAQYADHPAKLAAVISCQIGKGEAILTGVHIEYSSEILLALTSLKKTTTIKLG